MRFDHPNNLLLRYHPSPIHTVLASAIVILPHPSEHSASSARSSMTSRIVAAASVPPETVELLHESLAHGADVNATDQYGVSPLHLACCSDSFLEILSLLLERGANIAARTSFSSTPLHWAARHASLQTAQRLVEAGADILARDRHGWLPLHDAAAAGSGEMVRFLLEQLRLQHAAVVVNGLVGQLKNNTSGNVVACMPSREEELAHLAPGLDPSVLKPEPDEDVVRSRLELERSESQQQLPECCLDAQKALPVVHSIREFCRCVGRTISDPMLGNPCCGGGDSRSEQGPLTARTSPVPHVDDRDMYGSTPLHVAAAFDKIATVRELVYSGGADVHALNHDGLTPLHKAVIAAPVVNSEASILVARELLLAGACAHARKLKKPPLGGQAPSSASANIIEAGSGGCAVAQTSPCEPSGTLNFAGPSCLHIAAMQGNVWMCRLLLECKVNPDVTFVGTHRGLNAS
ncbi:hypothetical protein CAOG_04536 [Capsaspora owczarzaki ATCC 30864]|uniref:Uncharacterized protein n=1 Tax=Capsaspora owczarzaki (strain ATCC 30864) TaxID=595528 RepID=A0A0D2WRF1_CAPO3|nr:hypothetical protein CAOG_04536 [Capsaspora owczarzaki ATCC 30864]KJE93793.1 hypothetical protein CAOG_004536 [Capsaspora owczarzaki ATCC 30864]|eukprot:XP_004347283.1 hypothetical protein CAOG_04536 [Capsaspora owczarzaki ATCC 30864]